MGTFRLALEYCFIVLRKISSTEISLTQFWVSVTKSSDMCNPNESGHRLRMCP